MIQKRVISGTLFEKTFDNTVWKVVRVSPKIHWTGNGSDNLQRIRSLNFNFKEFYPLEKTTWSKYDLLNKIDARKREAKKYRISKLKNWILYSEPYFKVANRRQLSKMSSVEYNTFVNEFYKYNNENGFFDRVIKKMIDSCEGIQFEDGFVPMKDIEFKTILSEKEWSGYNRIQIQFRLK